MTEKERLTPLNTKDANAGGDYVLYWMQASQRAAFNPALQHAIERANSHKKPLFVVFCLVEDFPDAGAKHYRFMLEGLLETEEMLRKQGIKFILTRSEPPETVSRLSESAVEIITDRGYLAIERKWRSKLKRDCRCRLTEVDANVVVPVEVASGKQEYSAATIRKKITSRLGQFLVKPETTVPEISSLSVPFALKRSKDIGKLLESKRYQRETAPVFRGGFSEANKHLKHFISHNLTDYASSSNDPSNDIQSRLSPYLHFGQISPVYIALEVKNSRSNKDSIDSYLEQLIVRRELAFNFVWYNKNYDKYSCLPAWARASLNKHKEDKREYVYTYKQLENSQTHDPYWNAAQKELLKTGKMHGYMRMYWGKKIIEWTRSPKTAYRTALKLNNSYELDGRDPNGFTGVAWCFGLHDRPWTQRDIFGNVRYMNAAGLKRKFDIEKYVERVNSL
ncbi:deoxyribodipyrimidine photolyase [Limihaloglobus sulfuriphilus]|uniref:Deoxyribodipyrimidine photo-lyase n=1 Tax=Limihaloglobus sulfuriphilus TaxID=1851148 RepID=A0A1Q2MDX7_9BACT|nr:deoxyribodipyrimidine photo-lyase [Limihaloglobus sulfuriphilus]AQQ70906.1 deoxyribodipyrimidine photolyase [Limihaloglobus sulfuriphilus]